jgi:hypothetical protein
MLTTGMIAKVAPAVIAPLLVLLSGTTGHALLRRTVIGAEGNYQIAFPLLCILYGATAAGLAVYCLSLAGLLSAYGISALLIAQLVLAVFNLRFLSSLRASVRVYVGQVASGTMAGKVALLMAMIVFLHFVAAGLASAIVPNLEGDTATTYLNATKLYLQYQSIIDVGHFVGSMGRTGFLELAYAMGLSSANLAHAWVFMLAAAGFLMAFLLVGFVAGSSVAALLLVILVTSNYAYDWVIVPAKFDGLSFALSAAIAGMLYFSHGATKSNSLLPAAAVMIGFQAGLSYNNVFVCGLFLLWALGLWHRNGGEMVAGMFRLGTLAAVGAAPTYAHNLYLFGNPVYPFAASLFGSGLGTTIPIDGFAYGYIDQIRTEFSARSTAEALTLLRGLFTRGYHAEIQAQYDPWFGALMITGLAGGAWISVQALLPAQRAPFRTAKTVAWALWPAAILWIAFLAWAVTQHILRYLSAAMPLAFLGAACLFIGHVQPRARVFSRARETVVLVVMIILTFHWALPKGRQHFGYKFREARAWLNDSRDVNGYIETKFIYGSGFLFGHAIVSLGSMLKPGDKVLSFINGNYYFPDDIKVFSGNGSNTLPSPIGMAKPLSRYTDSAEWAAHLKKQGFCCVIINPDYLYLSDAEHPVIMGFLAGRTPGATVAGTNLYYLR